MTARIATFLPCSAFLIRLAITFFVTTGTSFAASVGSVPAQSGIELLAPWHGLPIRLARVVIVRPLR
jgi:hypothetical protein